MRLDGIRNALASIGDVAVIQSHRLFAMALIDQLRAMLQAIERFDVEIADVARTLPDYAPFSATPWQGSHLDATSADGVR